MKPRPYQEAAVQSVFDYFAENTGNPVIAKPTGTGKSIVIAEIIRRAIGMFPSTRILKLTHVQELIEQNYEKLLMLWPTAPAGIYSAGLHRKDIGKQVTFAAIQSVAKQAILFGHIDLILIDECHTVSPNEETTYRKFIEALKQYNPLLKVIGLTATPYRLGQGEIIEPGGIFTDICFDITSRDEFNKLISGGYLCPLIPRRMQTEIDISGVGMSRGDFNLKQLQGAVDRDEITRAAVAEMIQLGEGRAHWLIFAAGIKHAEHVAGILNESGIAAVCIHSKSGKELRKEGVAAFRAGKFRALVNNGVFTTGFDFPGIDLIGCLRHTTSPGLWVQMLGRGIRPVYAPGFDLETTEGRLAAIAAGGKPNCLVLDFAKNTERLGPINDPVKPTARKKKKGDDPGDVPAKCCEVCLAYNHASARLCSECGAEFKFKVKIQERASAEELIAGQEVNEPVTEWFNVRKITLSRHVSWPARKKHGKAAKASLRVSYDCGLREFCEYINLEHDGHALANARQWWTQSTSGLSIPPTVNLALTMTANVRKPERIRVWVNRKHPKILHREF